MNKGEREMIPSILIIEDEKNLRAVEASVLRHRGHKVWTAQDGEEGLALLAEHHPDVVLCDIRMPVMDGIVFLKRKKRLKDTTPVIVMTAVAETEIMADAIQLGAVDYLVKPVSVQDLVELIELVHQKRCRGDIALT